MEFDLFYQCLVDEQRRRILNLLRAGPLCVCFLQEILQVGQVKMSKQLATLKRAGLVRGERDGSWMIYSLVEPVPALLIANLKALEVDSATRVSWIRDREERRRVLARVQQEGELCRPTVVATCCVSSSKRS